VEYSGGAKALACNTPGIGVPGLGAATALVTVGNPDYSIAQVGFIHRWTPVKNLTFSGDVVWTYSGDFPEGAGRAHQFVDLARGRPWLADG
jgi:hypothetical protein